MIIGLTGNIASGKSTVSRILAEDYYLPVIDADVVSRKVVEPGEAALARISEVFGSEVLQEDGTLDRKKLGQIVFSDAGKRKQLDAIVHPAVREQMQLEKERLIAEGYEVIVMDIPLLFENNLTYLVDKTIVVYTKESIQLKRLMDRNGLSETEARQRMDAQMDARKKKELADEVVDNSGTLEASKQQIERIISKWGLKAETGKK
ncbi:dephospho-CoA kinase [Gracilibacillus ureilyticus]|uniref:Dephospho-CoA kinase n=1 Tax=Gracilibacillus ureilyticus TaxID=531814 RepID=A0A1H9UFK0_9BACI|nr:dephospho-CoA kinase [Gracilibacillus ureilyticus]SES07813.1 dephospho-CoA kinase [Gracilibacillus ureilyticus]